MKNKKNIIILIVLIIIVISSVVAYVNIFKDDISIVEQLSESIIEEMAVDSIPVFSGDFEDRDFYHKGSGKATFYKGESGNVLRLEDGFSVSIGPDLFVYLSKNEFENEINDLGEFISLGTLQSLAGDQSYNLPDDIDDYKTVVIYCRAFKFTFSWASLSSLKSLDLLDSL